MEQVQYEEDGECEADAHAGDKTKQTKGVIAGRISGHFWTLTPRLGVLLYTGSFGLLVLVVGGWVYNNVDKPKIVVVLVTLCLTGLLWAGAIRLIHFMDNSNAPPAPSKDAEPDAAVRPPSGPAPATMPTTTTAPIADGVVGDPAAHSTAPSRRFLIRKVFLSGFFSGSNFTGFVLDDNGNFPVTPLLFGLGGSTYRIVNHALIVSATVTDGRMWGTILDNVVTCPGNWDANQDESGMEIVNQDRRPVFQLFFVSGKGRGVLGAVTGAFRLSDKTAAIVYPSGITTIDIQKVNDAIASLRPMFQYPSADFPGKRAAQPAAATQP